MKNIVILQKIDGQIYCRESSEKGIEYMKGHNIEGKDENGFWSDGGTIVLEELEEILDKER